MEQKYKAVASRWGARHGDSSVLPSDNPSGIKGDIDRVGAFAILNQVQDDNSSESMGNAILSLETTIIYKKDRI